jgi:hypothetical protein
MCSVRFTISPQYRKGVERQLKTARQLGQLRQVHYLLAILAVMDGQSFAEVAVVLRVHEKTVAVWVRLFCCYGIKGGTAPKAHRPPAQNDPDAKGGARSAD